MNIHLKKLLIISFMLFGCNKNGSTSPYIVIDDVQYNFDQTDDFDVTKILAKSDNNQLRIGSESIIKVKNMDKKNHLSLNYVLGNSSINNVMIQNIMEYSNDEFYNSKDLYGKYTGRYQYCLFYVSGLITHYFTFYTGKRVAEEVDTKQFKIDNENITSIDVSIHLQPSGYTDFKDEQVDKTLNQEQIDSISSILRNGLFLVNDNSFYVEAGLTTFIFSITLSDSSEFSFYLDDGGYISTKNASFELIHPDLIPFLRSLI